MPRANMPRKARELRGFCSSRIRAVEEVIATWGWCLLLVVLALTAIERRILRATIHWKRIRLGEEA